MITVGAIDQAQTSATGDDVVAPWSAYGHTADGFAKPELSAPGRYLVMPVPTASTIATALPDRIVAPGYMWMSGTSFAAPVVSGAAAQLLARHPGLDARPGQGRADADCARRRTGAGRPVDLGTAADYAVLAGSTVTSTGPTTVERRPRLEPGHLGHRFAPGLIERRDAERRQSRCGAGEGRSRHGVQRRRRADARDSRRRAAPSAG